MLATCLILYYFYGTTIPTWLWILSSVDFVIGILRLVSMIIETL